MKLLVVTPFNETGWVWFGCDFGGGEYQWSFQNLALFGRKPWVWLWRALNVARHASEYDQIISHHPYMTFYLALALKFWGIKKPHHAFSFNHGNGKFFRGVMRWIAKKLFIDITGFVVYSKYEKKIYGDYYKIPYERISFVHWAVKPPEIEGNLPDYLLEHKPYICCLGRNNRDFSLFLDVVGELNVPAIVVSKKGQIDPSLLPNCVELHNDIPMKEAMQILQHAQFSVIPLKDASTGAGHMTIVSAMQLGIPQVITQLPTVDDYFIHGRHGLFVEPNSKASLKNSIIRLWNNPDELKKLSVSAKEFADTWLSEEASKKHLREYLRSVQSGGCLLSQPPGWLS